MMSNFVTFGSLDENEHFFARGKFHCKGSIGLFQKPTDLPGIASYNAFYYDGAVGKWAHFDDLALVQRYDESVHGKSADIIRFNNRQTA